MAYQRIVIVGVTGSGKTTLGRQLAAGLNYPHIELDALFWEPGWVQTPDALFRARVGTAISAHAGLRTATTAGCKTSSGGRPTP